MAYKLTKKEIAQTLADRDWWEELAKELEMRLFGFTFRSYASFEDQNHQIIEIPGSLALAIRKRIGI